MPCGQNSVCKLMPPLHQIIEQHWQQPNPWLKLLLWPLSRLFQTGFLLRRSLYRSGRLQGEKLAVPVVVVGNIHVGGVGKTPVTAALVNGLRQQGIAVGIISRGYGRQSRDIHVLNENSTAAEAGDEPLMLYRQTGAPMAVGSKRAEAGRALLAAHPELQLLVADDGMQHYALQRDVEIAVFPAADIGRRDLDLMPNGGLREPLARLHDVDAIVVTGAASAVNAHDFSSHVPLFASRLQLGQIYRLNQQQQKLDSQNLAGKRIAAVAAIAKPERFFNSLRGLGIPLSQTLALPDHAELHAQDWPDADMVLITEKDAVKLSDRHWENVWVLPVCAIIEPDLAEFVVKRLNLAGK